MCVYCMYDGIAYEKMNIETGSAFTNLAMERNGRLPLPISKDLFRHVVEAFDIPATFLAVLNTGLATYTSAIQTRSQDDGRSREIARQYLHLIH